MSESSRPTRRAKRLLSAEQKYEIWLKILTGELTTNEAAARAGVDRPGRGSVMISALMRYHSSSGWARSTNGSRMCYAHHNPG